MNHNEMPPLAPMESPVAEQLMQFQPTGEIEKDAVEFLRLTGREVVAEDRDSVIRQLTEIREALPEILEKISSETHRNKIQLEIDTIDSIIDMATIGRIQTPEERAELKASVAKLKGEEGNDEGHQQ